MFLLRLRQVHGDNGGAGRIFNGMAALAGANAAII
jgi:hypothetical protein